MDNNPCAIRCRRHPEVGATIDCWKCEDEYWTDMEAEMFANGEEIVK